MSEQATVAAFPVGTRVRVMRTNRPAREGVVVMLLTRQDGEVAIEVRGQNGFVGWYRATELERDDPPRAPEHVLAPGIVISDDTCDGNGCY